MTHVANNNDAAMVELAMRLGCDPCMCTDTLIQQWCQNSRLKGLRDDDFGIRYFILELEVHKVAR